MCVDVHGLIVPLESAEDEFARSIGRYEAISTEDVLIIPPLRRQLMIRQQPTLSINQRLSELLRLIMYQILELLLLVMQFYASIVDCAAYKMARGGLPF